MTVFISNPKKEAQLDKMADKGKGKATEAEAAQPAEAGETNPRGIPKAPYFDAVTDYVTSRADVEPVLRRFEEMISKYKFMEASLQRRVAGLDDKIPDIQKTADTVRFLKIRNDAEVEEPIETTFELNPTLYAKAEVKAKTEEVYLWLGANVMLSYPIEEAEELLEKRLSGARKSKGECEEDLDYLREQITTMEVNIARVYNWDVQEKRKEKEAGGDDKEASKGKENEAG